MPKDCRLRILLVEDNEGDAALVQEYVSRAGRGRFDLRHARTMAQGRQLLGEYDPQVILLDLNLPDSKGVETLDTFCAAGLPDGRPRPPIVVLTSLDDQEVAERAIAGCAQDYLVKNDVDARVLLRSIRFAVQRHGRSEVERMLGDPEKADGNQQEAMEILQRVNRTAPGEVGTSDEAGAPEGRLPGRDDPRPPGGFLLEHVVTGSKATEVILAAIDQRLRRLEDARHDLVVINARRELLMTQLERLVLGNGKGALAQRLDALENAMLAEAQTRRDRRSHRSQWQIAFAILVLSQVISLIAWLATQYLYRP